MEPADKQGGAMADDELQRQIDNDAIARHFLEVAKARAVRMGITYEEALAATQYILNVDFAESFEVGFKTFAGEFAARRGKKK